MDITPLIPKNKNFINSYGPLGFEINKVKYSNTLIVTPDQLLEVKVTSMAEIFEQDLSNFFNIEPEIMLVGTGKNYSTIPNQLKNKVKNYYPLISINEMTTDAACRTYNVLMSEDRNVAVILTLII